MPRQNIGWRAEMVASAAPGALSQVVPTSTVEEREGERARERGREGGKGRELELVLGARELLQVAATLERQPSGERLRCGSRMWYTVKINLAQHHRAYWVF